MSDPFLRKGARVLTFGQTLVFLWPDHAQLIVPGGNVATFHAEPGAESLANCHRMAVLLAALRAWLGTNKRRASPTASEASAVRGLLGACAEAGIDPLDWGRAE